MSTVSENHTPLIIVHSNGMITIRYSALFNIFSCGKSLNFKFLLFVNSNLRNLHFSGAFKKAGLPGINCTKFMTPNLKYNSVNAVFSFLLVVAGTISSCAQKTSNDNNNKTMSNTSAAASKE